MRRLQLKKAYLSTVRRFASFASRAHPRLSCGRDAVVQVTSVKVVYEVCRTIRFPMIVYAAPMPEAWGEQIDFTSFSGLDTTSTNSKHQSM